MKRVKDLISKMGRKINYSYHKVRLILLRWCNAVKLWLSAKYFLLFELVTLKAVLLTNKLVRKYIVMKGKDPDYVAPPPPEPTIDDVWGGSFKKVVRNPFVNLGVKNEWVTNPSSHPVLKLRNSWVPPVKHYEPVTQEEPLQVAHSMDYVASTEDELRKILETFNSDPEITEAQTKDNEE